MKNTFNGRLLFKVKIINIYILIIINIYILIIINIYLLIIINIYLLIKNNKFKTTCPYAFKVSPNKGDILALEELTIKIYLL